MRFTILAAVTLLACSGDGADAPDGAATAAPASSEPAFRAALAEATALADSVDRLLQPVPLLTPAQEAELRRYSNAQQLARARQLGVRPADSAHVARLLADGTLVRIPDSTAYWVVRRLEHSQPFVTPDALALLERISERFQREITRRGLPPYRLEITSVLRTPESQADLRRSNVNAAAGESTHEMATTLDVAYSSFAAPVPSDSHDLSADDAWLAPYIVQVRAALLEAAAARKSRELQMILGQVLIELQRAGDVMVTLERQQPVYHFTVARRLR